MLAKIYETLIGFHPGALYGIAGRPGVGKTSLMLNVALDYAQKFNKKVLIFSLEMMKSKIADAIYNISGEDQSIMKLPIYIADDYSLGTPNKIKEVIDEAKPDIVFIDYYQLMHDDNKGKDKSRYQERHDIIHDLSAIAKEFNIPIVFLYQLSRESHLNGNHRPTFYDTNATDIITQNCNHFIFVHDTDYYSSNRARNRNIEIIIAKNEYDDNDVIINAMFDANTRKFTL